MTVGVETPNELMVVFSNTISAGFDALQGSVNGVFGLLIVLVVALTGIQWALSPNREVLASGFGKVLLIGAFAWLINDWQQLSETVYAGFLELGLTAGGGSLSREEFLNPGAILAQGWEIVKALGETPAPVDNPLDIVGNMADALILGLAMIGIMLAFAVLALQIIVSLLEFKIVTLGGFVLLPFGIWNKSAFLAERPLGYVVSSGLKVLALAIVVSGARTIFDQLQPSANPDIYEALTILVAAILLAMLALFIPNLASALVTGGPALGAGAALTGALAVGGAGALAGGAARLAGPARAAAGASSGRPPLPPNPPGPSSTGTPSNDNPPPSGPRRPSGGAMTPPPPSGASGVNEPAAAWRQQAEPTGGGAGEPAAEATPWSGAEGPSGGGGRSPGAIAAEARTARADFHRAASRPATAAGSNPRGRSAALQAFFVANAGRGLLPSGETSGVLSPNLKTEES
ncbi:P-type conjugative transfer protein TrbL [uncultured Brevundimonas sp.]|uniref:P-type conjugative transfer protein TrbL n=1 Tax=uncultured Brevundimonas sp. TaxID=213418 RepID=UPI0030EB3624|tara:strand:+ start:45298 stop:46680 length:1383 start_codon:yes stop_codon:yes gene_type:complete